MQQPRLNASLPVVSEDRTMELPFRKFMTQLDRSLPIVGSGNPEGVVDAAYLSLYIDEGAGQGLISYRKMQASVGGDRKNGWQQLSVNAAAWGGVGGLLSEQTDLQAALDEAGTAPAWGEVTGTLSNQTDLQSALDAAGDAAVWGGIGGDISTQSDLVSVVNTAYADLSVFFPQSLTAIAAATYTPTLSDANKVLRFTGASPAVTIPLESSVDYSVGVILTIRQAGTGTLTLTTTGLTINGTVPTWAQHVEVNFRKVGTNEWDVF